MRKGSELLGLNIVAFDSGERIDTIKDIIFDQEANEIRGFVVDEGGWFHSARVLPLNAVRSIGDDAVIIESKESIIGAKDHAEIGRIMQSDNVLKGIKLMTVSGRDLGSLHDVFFDEKTGRAEGYEVSGGIFADMYTGRSFVPAPQTIKIGHDVAFVPDETEQLMEEQVGGFKGAVQHATDKAGELKDSASEKLGELKDSASEKFGDLKDATSERYDALKDSTSERFDQLQSGVAIEETKGLRVKTFVRGEGGMILAAPGQIVTDTVIERTRAQHREGALLAATGLETGGTPQNRAGNAAHETGERISQATAVAGEWIGEGFERAKEGATNLWDNLKGKVTDYREKAVIEAEEKRVKNALGRPVTQIILDKQDKIILNVGEIITHQAIELSRQNGELDVLLDSVYEGNPDIAENELRADQNRIAALKDEHQPVQYLQDPSGVVTSTTQN